MIQFTESGAVLEEDEEEKYDIPYENNNTQKVVVVENQNGTANVLDPATLSAMLNTNDENGISHSEDDYFVNEDPSYSSNVISGDFIGENKLLHSKGDSHFVYTTDEERVFNVTDTVTVQDAYLASVKMGHFNGLEEHAYSCVPGSPHNRRRSSSNRTPERRRSSYPSPGKRSSEKSPYVRCLSSDMASSPQASQSPTSKHALRGDSYDDDWMITHGSDSEGTLKSILN